MSPGQASYGIGAVLSGSNYYEEVGREQVHLTEREEIELVEEYKMWKDKLHWYVLHRDRCVKYFLSVYDGIVRAGTSIARLSANSNTRKAGHNAAIDKDFLTYLAPDTRVSYSMSHKRVVLFHLRLSNDIYDEMLEHLTPTDELRHIQENMERIEDVLLRSMLMAAQEIAKKNSSRILSIDERDAAQEVLIYFLDSIRRYDPDYQTPQGKRVKLLTFAYGRGERLIKEWIINSSRLVRVPRSKMERILVVAKAYDGIDSNETNLFTITEEANKILKGRTGLRSNNMFTTEEVDGLIKILMSNYIHLDQPFNRHNKTNPTTIGEMISNDDPLALDTIQEADEREQLLEAMQDNLEKLELQVMTLRWFHNTAGDVPKALAEIGPLLKAEYGGVCYSRESIRKIEKRAIKKLEKVREVKRLW
jgi:RNA polymerase sigma factor (sigma-70 family)